MLATTDQIEQYLDCLYESGDWIETRGIWPNRDENHAAQKRWHQVGRFTVADLDYLHNLNKAGWNIYIGVNPRKGNGLSGDESVALCRCLFADFDHIGSQEGMSPSSIVLDWIDEKGLPGPTMVVCSGHGIHVYWRLKTAVTPDVWRPVMERLIQHLQSDPAIKNAERIMRLPGTMNTKAEPYLPCFVVYCESDTRYDLDEIARILPEKAEPTPASPQLQATKHTILEATGRAMLYAAKWEGVQQGERNRAAFAHSCQMLNDFALAEAWQIIADWNQLNMPPLDERELRSAFDSAKTHAKKPQGCKLDQPRQYVTGTQPPTQAIKTQPSGDAVTELSAQVEGEISGRIVNLTVPGFPLLTEFGQCFLAGTRTILAGSIGGSKSLLMLQILAAFLEQGIRVAILELERKRAFHLKRVLAQQCGIADVTKSRWVHENGEKIRALMREHEDFLRLVGSAIHVPEHQVTVAETIAWLHQRAEAGDRVLCVDPVTILARSKEPWRDDERLINAANHIAEAAGVSIVFVTHPKKGGGGLPDLDSLAGGAAWARFPDSVLWLEAHEPTTAKVRLSDGCGGLMGTDSVTYNRTLYLLKTRSGEGQGWRLACTFDATKGLVMREQGVLVRRKRNRPDSERDSDV